MCELHPKRKRKDCKDCFPDEESISISVIDSNENLEPPISENQNKFHDSKAIRVMIEAEITKAIAKVRSEISDLMQISWEHMYIPYGSFSFELMKHLERDGWKYCELIKNPRQFGYFADGDIFLVQRIVKKDNAPKIDFTKPNAVKKYMEKNNV